MSSSSFKRKTKGRRSISWSIRQLEQLNLSNRLAARSSFHPLIFKLGAVPWSKTHGEIRLFCWTQARDYSKQIRTATSLGTSIPIYQSRKGDLQAYLPRYPMLILFRRLSVKITWTKFSLRPSYFR